MVLVLICERIGLATSGVRPHSAAVDLNKWANFIEAKKDMEEEKKEKNRKRPYKQ